jgi:murein DD-endopeptidase MepM/ murein hydrolase activator NlpD
VSFDSKTQKIEIHDPIDGLVIATIDKEIVWPVKGIITLEFGQIDLPYQPFHTGIDIANPNHQIGDPITPFMEGKVIYAGEISWGFGKHIIIDNGNNIQSIYAHLNKIYVYVGKKVKPGDIIGEEGETGWATGPHLHFQINIFGIPVNPRIFLGEGNP